MIEAVSHDVLFNYYFLLQIQDSTLLSSCKLISMCPSNSKCQLFVFLKKLLLSFGYKSYSKSIPNVGFKSRYHKIRRFQESCYYLILKWLWIQITTKKRGSIEFGVDFGVGFARPKSLLKEDKLLIPLVLVLVFFFLALFS